MAEATIWLHRDAPAKPPAGSACNGCGVCCASEPCPPGMLLSLRVRGRCRLLRFDAAHASYRCGLMPESSNAPQSRFVAWRRRLRRRLAARWIGAGLGCDSLVEAIGTRSGGG
jgi:hypothetical protein